MNLIRSIAVSLLLFSNLTGCQQEATGQVAAVVNGDEITLQEVNAEIAAMQLPETVEKDQARREALKRIVERRLLAQAAKDDGLDTSQEFLLRERQLRDNLLVQLLAERVDRTTSQPEREDIDQYISDNPGIFADRKVYTIDRIQLPMPSNLGMLDALKDDHSMEAVAKRLDSMGIQFRRDVGQIDAAAIGPDRLQVLLSLPDGEPFVIPENGVVTIGVITGERLFPLTGEEARPLAARRIRAEKLNASVQQRLSQARATAEIEYQPGFEPKADTQSGGGDKSSEDGS